MAAVIIRKKDVDRFGRKLMKEVYKFLHDEYILNNFSEMKLEKQRLEKDLVLFKFESLNYTIVQKEKSWNIKYEDFDKSKHEKELKIIEDEIENERLNIKLIFTVLNRLNLDMEIDEDLFYKNEAFLNIFKVFDSKYEYLED